MDEFDDEDDQYLATIDLDVPEIKQKSEAQVEEDNSTPETFPFPFEAYDIQKGFMKELYKCLNNSKIGIFESPTGTGKSLSLICGALKWLKDFREKQQKELEELSCEENSRGNSQPENKNGELDWIAEFSRKKEKEEKLHKIKEEHENIEKREAKLRELGKGAGTHQVKRKRVKMEDDFDDLMKDASGDIKAAFEAELEALKKECNLSGDANLEDAHLMLDDYCSDDETEGRKKEESLDEEDHITKIYFCSRTHSQLSQFVREVIKSPYGDDTRVISLGSRQNLCINEAVKKIKSLSLMNETCLDMQKKGKKSSSKEQVKKRSKVAGCSYYKYELLQDFKDSVLLEVRDIEQLASVGKKMKACPYYGTRYAIPAAEIVALPYNTLLHKSTREACGIKLKDNVVIIDEAHNLLETINSIYSVEVTGAQALRAHNQLTQYEKKYRSRLKAKNLMYVKQILYILAAIVKCLGGKVDESSDKQIVSKSEIQLKTINNFLFISQLDNLNLFKVLRYCERSQISKKLHGFIEKYADTEVHSSAFKKESNLSGVKKFLNEIKQKTEPSVESVVSDKPVSGTHSFDNMSSPLMHIESFLEALTNCDKDGRIVVNKQGLLSQSSLKFLLLNPAVHFSSIVEQARSIIVAGGTMQPISEFTDQLFHSAGVSPSRVALYSCGHVIPADHILPLTIATGPSGQQMDFTYQFRDSPSLVSLILAFSTQYSNMLCKSLS
ncbi:hypothetical protein SNE40_016013 [Patella caerulea]|uniref:Helicase ATP-binding domain-containing protein n=1 Tax=Patella caerulea TaxID=87958 RepID=A0AAN8P7H1_PATCE